MVRLKDFTDFLHTLAPLYLAEDYDNVGLLVESEKSEIESVLISLDADNSVVKEALKNGCDMVLCHHPLIFTPLKKIEKTSPVFSLVKNNIALYAMHTNFDAVQGGLCDALLKRICNFKEVFPLDGEEDNALGRIAVLKEKVRLSEFAKSIKDALGLDALRIVGSLDKEIETVANCNGGGADFL